MDVAMPGRDGFETIREILTLYENVKSRRRPQIVGLSAHALEAYGARGLSSGMDSYLSKPLTLRQLDNVVREVLLDEKQVRGARLQPPCRLRLNSVSLTWTYEAYLAISKL